MCWCFRFGYEHGEGVLLGQNKTTFNDTDQSVYLTCRLCWCFRFGYEHGEGGEGVLHGHGAAPDPVPVRGGRGRLLHPAGVQQEEDRGAQGVAHQLDGRTARGATRWDCQRLAVILTNISTKCCID